MGCVLGRYRFPGKRIVIGLFAIAIFSPEDYTIIPIFDVINRMHLPTSLWGLTSAGSGGAHIVAVLLFAGYFNRSTRELEESAAIDGAGLLRIYLPLAGAVKQ